MLSVRSCGLAKLHVFANYVDIRRLFARHRYRQGYKTNEYCCVICLFSVSRVAECLRVCETSSSKMNQNTLYLSNCNIVSRNNKFLISSFLNSLHRYIVDRLYSYIRFRCKNKKLPCKPLFYCSENFIHLWMVQLSNRLGRHDRDTWLKSTECSS